MPKLVRKKQRELIYEHLVEHSTITSWEAIKEYGITRLSDVIFRLRKEGFEIVSENTSSVNRYGNKVSFATYTLIK